MAEYLPDLIIDGVRYNRGVNVTPGGVNTSVQYYDGNTFAGSNSFTFDYTTNTLSVSYINTTSFIAQEYFSVGNSSVNIYANSTTILVGSNVVINTGIIIVGNTVSLNSTILAVGTNVVVNTTAVAVGANVVVNLDSIKVGNSTVNTFVNSTSLSVSNSTFITNVTPSGLFAGDSVANSSGYYSGNSTVNSVANSSSFKISNSTVNTALGLPTAGQYSATNYFLHANGTWTQISSTSPGGSNTQVMYNDSGSFGGSAGFTFDKATNNAVVANTVSVGANVIANTSAVFVGNATVNAILTSTLLNVGLYQGNTTLGKVTVYTSNGTHTKVGNLLFMDVIVVGAGGGGGGALGNTTFVASAGAGGGGGTSFKRLTNSLLRSTETVTVGIGGTNGASTPGSGTAGSNSVFGNSTSTFTQIIGRSGGAGTLTNTTSTGTGGTGGAPTGGDVNISGGDGTAGYSTGTSVDYHGLFNKGGSSMYGIGGQHDAGLTAGAVGKLYGGGGSGGHDSAGGQPGGSGANGIVIVYEYYNGA